ncbi:MAG: CPBP family intramembrane glutamic endopeptidase [Planctomycetota bacterium]
MRNATNDGPRMTTWTVILLVVVLNFALSGWLSAPPALRPVVRAIRESSGGLVSPMLWLRGMEALVVLGGGAFLLGRLRWHDLGVQAAGILPALAFTAGLWGAMQLGLLVIDLPDAGRIVWNEEWWVRPTWVLGGMSGDFLGTALCEELVFRGFLLTQIEAKLRAALGRRSHWSWAVALLASSIVFAIGHIPYDLRHGTPAADYPLKLVVLTLYGVLFAVIYLRSGNLLYAVGVHGLVNAPGLLVQDEGGSTTFLVLLVLCWLALAPLYRGLTRLAVELRRRQRTAKTGQGGAGEHRPSSGGGDPQ